MQYNTQHGAMHRFEGPLMEIHMLGLIPYCTVVIILYMN